MISTIPAGTVTATYFATRTGTQFVKPLDAIDDARRNRGERMSAVDAARRAPAGSATRDAAQVAGYVPDVGTLAKLRLQASTAPGSVARGSLFNLVA